MKERQRSFQRDLKLASLARIFKHESFCWPTISFIYIHTGTDTGFSSGGGQGGTVPPPEIALSKDFAPFIK